MNDRLFIPLNSEPWQWFRDGQKSWELRRQAGRFTTKNIRVGRRVELRRGYSTPDSLWGEVAEVRTYATLGDAILDIGPGVIPNHIAPSPKARFDHAAGILGTATGPFIAFRASISPQFLSTYVPCYADRHTGACGPDCPCEETTKAPRKQASPKREGTGR